jgi:ABC-2 type transport system ATP-binding protein
MENAIRTERLSKTYKGKKGKQVEALKNLNLEIFKGEVFGFLGPNGAGKSTTIKLLMGLVFPSSGSFSINGIEGSHMRNKSVVGYLPENPSFYDYLTGEELLSFVGKTFGMRDENIYIESERVLKLLDLHDARERPIRSYSKGMVQRLGLAQCLIHDPDILILDEPMSGLDPIGRILVRDIILNLKSQGKCVFMSTHILNDIETICDRVGIIVNGELRHVESIRDIMSKGIKGYLITFNNISNRLGAFLRSVGEEVNMRQDSASFLVKQDTLESALAEIVRDAGTSLRIIEPMRRGLEELFTEIVHDGRA